MAARLPDRKMQQHMQGRSSIGTIISWIRSELFWFIFVLSLTAFLALYRLESFPRLEYDEGYYLQMSKNLAEHGEYALSYPAQRSDLFGVGNDSPTLIVPIAVTFKLFGTSATPVRLIPALYFIGAMLVVYFLSRRLYDWPTAVLAMILVLLAGPREESSTILMGRQVFGELPALFFILIAAWLWFRSWEDDRLRWSIGSGLMFGLAFVTKTQFLPIVVPALALLWLADRFIGRQLKLQHLVVPLIVSAIPVGAWYAYKWIALGPELFGQHLSILRSVSGASTWRILPDHWAGSVSILYDEGFAFLGLPGLLYAFASRSRHGLNRLHTLFCATLATGFLLWYVFLSIGWLRYAYAGVMLAAILTAKPLHDVIVAFAFSDQRIWAGWRFTTILQPLAAVLIVIAIVGYPLYLRSSDVFKKEDRTSQDFAEFLKANTEADARIESFSWEIDFLAERSMHHPAPDVFVRLLYGTTPLGYDPITYDPDYLVHGPYSKGSGLYTDEWLSEHGRLIGSVGTFDLYAVH